MTTLTLVDPQPMETLPSTGMVFLDYTFNSTNERMISNSGVDVDVIRHFKGTGNYTYHAWSRTATFGEGTDGTK